MRVEAECPCGRRARAEWPDEIDAAAAPHLRAALLGRTLDRLECPGCGRGMRVEAPLLYTDPPREIRVRHLPGGDRDRWREAVADPAPLVFGVNDLVERVLVLEAGLDPAAVEVLKALAVLGRTDVRPPDRYLHFEAVAGDRILIRAVGPELPGEVLAVPRADYDRVREGWDRLRRDPALWMVVDPPYQNYLKVLEVPPEE